MRYQIVSGMSTEAICACELPSLQAGKWKIDGVIDASLTPSSVFAPGSLPTIVGDRDIDTTMTSREGSLSRSFVV